MEAIVVNMAASEDIVRILTECLAELHDDAHLGGDGNPDPSRNSSDGSDFSGSLARLMRIVSSIGSPIVPSVLPARSRYVRHLPANGYHRQSWNAYMVNTVGVGRGKRQGSKHGGEW